MKNVVKLFAVMLAALFLASCSADQPVMWVGSKESGGVSAARFSSYYQMQAAEFSDTYGKAYEELKDQSGTKKGTTIDDDVKDLAAEQIIKNAAVEELAKQNNISTESVDTAVKETFNKLVQSKGGSSSFKKYLGGMKVSSKYFMEMLRYSELSKRTAQAIGDKNGITQEKLKDEAALNFIRYKQILIKNTDNTGAALSADEAAKAKQKADELKARASAGEDFDALINENNQDLQQDVNKGYLLYTADHGQSKLEIAVLTMGQGEIQMVEDEQGYHVIKLYPTEGEAFELIKDEVKTRVLQTEFDEQVQKQITLIPSYIYKERLKEQVKY